MSTREKTYQNKPTKFMDLIWNLVFVLFVYFVFFRDQFPKAWKEPTYGSGLAGVFLLLGGFLYLIGIVLRKKEKALASALFFLGLSGLYFIVSLIRTYIWVRN